MDVSAFFGKIMRTVSTCQIISNDPDTYGRAIQIVEDWATKKFDESGSVPRIRRSGQDAIFIRNDNEHQGVKRRHYQTEEHVEGGLLRTEFSVLGKPDKTAMLCVQSLVSNSLAPPRVEISLPRFVGDIIQQCHGCRASTDRDRLFKQAFHVTSRNIDELGELIFAPNRVLPVIVVSEFDGQSLTRAFPDRLAERISGLAHVCLLSADASWGLTTRYGKEWSAYNGAVKLYWPGAAPEADGKSHPLWTYDRMAERYETDAQAAAWLTKTLVDLVREASAYTSVDNDFDDFDRELERSQIKDQLKAAEDNNGFRQLAELYAADNEKLKARIEEITVELRLTKSKLRAVYPDTARRSLAGTSTESDAPPSTVTEAVEAAVTRYRDTLARIIHQG